METKRYKPLLDKYFWIVWGPLLIFLICMTIFFVFEFVPLIIMLCVDVFTFYFMFSSLVAYVELRDEVLYIKFGFILKKEIPYNDIREIVKERKLTSYSILSIKNSIEHINIKYNKFDMVTVSVIENDDLIKELEERIKKKF